MKLNQEDIEKVEQYMGAYDYQDIGFMLESLTRLREIVRSMIMSIDEKDIDHG